MVNKQIFGLATLIGVGSTVFLGLSAGRASASVMFSFQEVGGSVLMESSGTLNTSLLIPVTSSGWGGVGVETNPPPQSDIMGDTTMGPINTVFGFSSGTDLSSWVGDMFTSSKFYWNSTGSTQFTTYFFDNNFLRTPGIGIGIEDLVGAFWTPDISWNNPGTYASLGLTPGTYSIVDAATNESITIQIGNAIPASVPGPLPVFGVAAAFGMSRKLRNRIKAHS
jgi:hypothetical protein